MGIRDVYVPTNNAQVSASSFFHPFSLSFIHLYHCFLPISLCNQWLLIHCTIGLDWAYISPNFQQLLHFHLQLHAIPSNVKFIDVWICGISKMVAFNMSEVYIQLRTSQWVYMIAMKFQLLYLVRCIASGDSKAVISWSHGMWAQTMALNSEHGDKTPPIVVWHFKTMAS